MVRNKGLLGVVVLTCLVVASGVSGAGAESASIVVDDDRVECPTADVTSIQAAVAAADAYGRVLVCPGSYDESVTIPKPLTLSGARHGQRADRRCHDRVVDPTRDSVLQHAGVGFDVRASDVVIDGFTILPAADGDIGAGIATSESFSGYRIENSVIERNAPGIFLHSDGADATVVQHNCLRDNSSPPPFGPTGIVSLSGARLANASLHHNFLTGHAFGMGFFGTQSELWIADNKFVDGGSIELQNTTASSVTHNVSIGARRHAVALSSSSDVAIRGNRLERGALGGVVVFAVEGRPPTARVLVEGNRISEFPRGGIIVNNASDNTLVGNRVSASGTVGEQRAGILLGDRAAGNTVQGNRVRDSRGAGVLVWSTGRDNVITGNRVRGSLELDCHDDSDGDGTAGTANVWSGNRGETENRPGLCRHRFR